MTAVRADALEVGMRTAGGQEVLDIRRSGVQYSVTWQPTGSKRKVEIGYFPDQEFDMAPRGGTGARMAQKVNIIVTSDLSDAEGAETVSFGLDGTTYEIDLTEKEQGKLREALAKYVGAARQVKGSKARKSAASHSGPAPREIREWAQANGHSVPERGRIPAEVREAYAAAH